MANSLFCSGCGKKILFEAIKPKCCGYCGRALDGGLSSFAVTKPTPISPISRRPLPVQVVEEPEEDCYYGGLMGLDVIVNVAGSTGEKLANLAYQKPEAGIKFKSNKRIERRTQKLDVVPDNLPQFMKDSGAGSRVLEEPRISESAE